MQIKKQQLNPKRPRGKEKIINFESIQLLPTLYKSINSTAVNSLV